MPKKISVDEILSTRGDLAGGSIISKAARAPASWNKDNRSARFVMNSQATDRYGDIVVTEGIDTTEFEKNPVALLFHSSRSWPVGSWANLEKILKGRPPRIEGDVILLPSGGPVEEVDKAAWMIENGGLRACSIGFKPDWDQAEMILDEEGKWTGGIKWTASELLECSLVSVPASPQALIKDAAGDWRLAKEFVEEVLDTYSRTPEGLLVPKDLYEKAYRTTIEKILEDTPVEPVAPKGAVAEPAVDEKTVETPSEDDKAAPLTDEVLNAFAALVKADDVVVLRDADHLKLVIERSGEEVEYLLLPDDMTITQIREVQASIAKRAAPAPVKEVDPLKSKISIGLDLDTTEATEQLSGLERLIDSVTAKMARLFGKAAEPDVDKSAPEVKAAPTQEEVDAMKARAASILADIASKELI